MSTVKQVLVSYAETGEWIVTGAIETFRSREDALVKARDMLRQFGGGDLMIQDEHGQTTHETVQGEDGVPTIPMNPR